MHAKRQTNADLDRKLEFPKNYRPIQLIGCGAFATVFAAERFIMKRSAAVGGVRTTTSLTTTTAGGDDDGSSLTHEDFEGELVAIKKQKDFTLEKWISNPKAVSNGKPAKYKSNLKNICRELSALKTFAHIPEVVGVKDAYLSADGKDLYMVLEFEQMDWNGFFNPTVPERKELPQVGKQPRATLKQRESERKEEQQKIDAEWKKAIDAVVKPRLIEDNFRFMICQVLIGLHAIHSLGYVHRDLSSGNLLIDQKTLRCLIADFGLCRSMMEEAVAGLTTADLGTRPYRAPEILAAPQKRDLTKSQYNALADIWSAGCALVEMCIGTPVFDAPCGQGRKADDWTNLEANCRLFYGYKSKDEMELINADPKVIDWMEAKVKNGEEAIPGVLWKDLKATDVGATMDKYRQEAGLPLLSDECKEVARAMVQFLPSDRKSAADLLQMPWFQNDKRCRELIQQRLTLLEEEKNSAFSLMEKVKDEDAAYEQCIRETLVTQGLVPCDSVEFPGVGTESAPLCVEHPIWSKLVASGLIPSCLTPEFCSLPKLEKYSSPSATAGGTADVTNTGDREWVHLATIHVGECSTISLIGRGVKATKEEEKNSNEGPELRVEKLIAKKQNSTNCRREKMQFERDPVHTNIVPYKSLDDESSPTHLRVTLEFMNHGSLDRVIRNCGTTKPPLCERLMLARSVAFQVLHGLTYLHNYYHDQGGGIIHRDIKPGNILVNSAGRIKICDFNTSDTSDRVSATGVGSYRYFAPEQYLPIKKHTTSLDIWPVGIITLQLAIWDFETPDWEKESDDGGICKKNIDWNRLSNELDENVDERAGLLYDMLRRCLQDEAENRPTANELLKHDFFLKDLSPSKSQLPQGLKPIVSNDTTENEANLRERLSQSAKKMGVEDPITADHADLCRVWAMQHSELEDDKTVSEEKIKKRQALLQTLVKTILFQSRQQTVIKELEKWIKDRGIPTIEDEKCEEIEIAFQQAAKKKGI